MFCFFEFVHSWEAANISVYYPQPTGLTSKVGRGTSIRINSAPIHADLTIFLLLFQTLPKVHASHSTGCRQAATFLGHLFKLGQHRLGGGDVELNVWHELVQTRNALRNLVLRYN